MDTDIQIPRHIPPTQNTADYARWVHTALREDILDSNWLEHAKRRMYEMVGSVRARNWGKPDRTKNPFLNVVSQLSVLYDACGRISHESKAVDEFDDKLTKALLWPILQENQFWTVGLRQNAVRVKVVKGKPVFELISPSRLSGFLSPDMQTPSVLVIWRNVLVNQGTKWIQERFDLSNPDYPIHQIADQHGTIIEEMAGGQYPYRGKDQEPFMPVELYHAKPPTKGCLFSPYFGQELVEATLNLSGHWSHWGHGVRNASWPQRYGVDVQPYGGSADPENEGQRNIVTDPSSILLFRAQKGGSPSLGQFAPGSDPEALGRSLQGYEAASLGPFGITPIETQRVAANPRSGYAISLNKEQIQSHQRKMLPLLQQSDARLVQKTAKMLNLLTGSSYEEDGYIVHYNAIPESKEAQEVNLDMLDRLLDRKMIGPDDYYMRVHNVSREVAQRELARINAGFGEQKKPEQEPSDTTTGEPVVSSEPEETIEKIEAEAVEESEVQVKQVQLNGAQMAAQVQILEFFSSGTLTADAARLILEGVVSPERAAELISAQAKQKAIPPTTQGATNE